MTSEELQQKYEAAARFGTKTFWMWFGDPFEIDYLGEHLRAIYKDSTQGREIKVSELWELLCDPQCENAQEVIEFLEERMAGIKKLRRLRLIFLALGIPLILFSLNGLLNSWGSTDYFDIVSNLSRVIAAIILVIYSTRLKFGGSKLWWIATAILMANTFVIMFLDLRAFMGF